MPSLKGASNPNWRGGKYKKCKICGKKFWASPSQINERRTCSRECIRIYRHSNYSREKNPNWKGGKVRVKCKNCGKIFYVKPCEKQRAKFCSSKCMGNYRRKTGFFSNDKNPNWRGGTVAVRCVNCGKTFGVKPYKRNNAKYCSIECKAEWMSKNQVGINNPAYGRVSYPKPFYVEELGHSVRSKWEEEIGLLLKVNGISYSYEAKTFKFNGTSYTPDFIVGDNVIEVKGPLYNLQRKKYKEFNELHPELNFIIVGTGDEDICDIHIPWGERERLIEVLS